MGVLKNFFWGGEVEPGGLPVKLLHQPLINEPVLGGELGGGVLGDPGAERAGLHQGAVYPGPGEEKDSFLYAMEDRRALDREMEALEELSIPARLVEKLPLPFPTVGGPIPHSVQIHPLHLGTVLQGQHIGALLVELQKVAAMLVEKGKVGAHDDPVGVDDVLPGGEPTRPPWRNTGPCAGG